MSRTPKPFAHRGWYKTNLGGPPRTNLCRETEGVKHAQVCLNTWAIRVAEVKEKGLNPTGLSPAGYLQAIDSGSLMQPEELSVAPLKTAHRKSNLQTPSALEAHDDFLDFKQIESDPATYEHYVTKLKPFLERFGLTPLATLTEEDGLQFKRWLKEERPWKKGKVDQVGMSPCSVNHSLRAARTLFNWVVDSDARRRKYGVAHNPWKKIKYLAEQERERLITDAEFASLLKHCTDDNFRQALIVLRNSTLRPGELRKLDWSYVRWDIHQVVFPPKVIKTRNRRSITLIDAAEEVLKARWEEQGKPHSGIAFLTQQGKEWGHSSFSRKFRLLRDKCVERGEFQQEKGGEKLVLYSSRHTRITEMYVEGNSTAEVMHDSGHKTFQMAERYKHLTSEFVAGIRSRARKENKDETSQTD